MIAQTFTDWELIIVDDGSSDTTKEVVELYRDSRIRYVWQENQERSAARNHGIGLAVGDWICFQDSDDEYKEDHLSVLYESIMIHPECKVFRTGLDIYTDSKFDSRSQISPRGKYDCYPYECYTVATFHSSILHKDAFDTRFYVSEDLHFLIKIALCHDVCVLPFWTGVYYRSEEKKVVRGIEKLNQLTNQKTCLEDILTWNDSLILPYLHQKLCLCELMIMRENMTHDPKKIPRNIWRILTLIYRYPTAFVDLVWSKK